MYSVISKYLLNWYYCGYSFTLGLSIPALEKMIDLSNFFLSSKQLWARWCWPLCNVWFTNGFLTTDHYLSVGRTGIKLALPLIILGIFLVINQPSQLWQLFDPHVSGFGFVVQGIRASIQQFEKAYLFITSESILGSSITACLTRKKRVR